MSLKYAILGLLDEEPCYGYEIKHRFEETMGDLWPISYGQLYPTLRRLTGDNLVTVQVVQGKKAVDKRVYSITEKGKALFNRWLFGEDKKIQTSIKDEFSLSLFFAERMKRDELVSAIRKLHKKTIKRLSLLRGSAKSQGLDSLHYKEVSSSRKMELMMEAEEMWLRELLEDLT